MVSKLNSLKNVLNGPVLVTGHTGFKGTWLTLLLEELGVEVLGYSLRPEEGSLFERIGREGAISEKYGDVRNFENIKDFILRKRPVAVLHLAAQPLVIESYETPHATFETNVMGTVNLLESSFQSDTVKTIIGITTDKVYKNDNKGGAFKESDALNGKDPYSASKVGSEAAISAWQQIAKSKGGPKVVAARAGNVIGGGDWAKDRLIPDLIRGFSNNEVVMVRNPLSTRPWQHVLDPLLGYLFTLYEVLSGENFEAINFGPKDSSLTVGEVVEIASKCWGPSAKVLIGNSTESVYEASKLDLDSAMATELLGWEPVWSQESAVENTILWWKSLILSEINPHELCLNDIKYALEKTTS